MSRYLASLIVLALMLAMWTVRSVAEDSKDESAKNSTKHEAEPQTPSKLDKKDRDRFEMTPDEKTLLEMTNKERAKHKLPALDPNPLLFIIARAHAANMARQQKDSHILDGKSVADRARAVDYDYAKIGENIAWSEGASLEVIMGSWMMSKKGHRENILHVRYREIGLGIARDTRGETYYAQVMGVRRGRK